MIGASLYRASTVVSVCVAVPTTWLTYSTTFACSSDNNLVIFGSSATVLELSTFDETDSTLQRPFSKTSSMSNSDSRSAYANGSDNTTVLPVFALVTLNSGISTCA